MIDHTADLSPHNVLSELMWALESGQAPFLTLARSRIFVCGDVCLDEKRHGVFRGNELVRLAPREYSLFLMLALHDGAAVPKALLLSEIWKDNVNPASRTICQHILELRRKIERDPARPECILTVAKFGYRVVGEWIEAAPVKSAGKGRYDP